MVWTRVASPEEMEEGDVKAFYAGNRRIALAKSDGVLYAFDDECTHRQCSLSDGDVEGVSLMCPCHGGEFDLSTGAVIGGPPPEPIRLYPVEESDGDIRVDLPDGGDSRA